jgi:glucose 1-dehydrogenase
MKAFAVWAKQKRSGVVEIDEPRLASPTAVKLRMLDVGVCGTDAELCAFAYGEPPEGETFLVTGHEALGEVVEVGDEVEWLDEGDLVVPSVRRPCPHVDCPACRAGHQDFCLTGDYTERGIKGAHGFLAETVVEEARYLTAVSSVLREVAVLTEPLTIAEKGLRQFLEIERRLPWNAKADDEMILRGKRAVVLGAGPVGLLGAMLLLERGLEVIVYSRSPKPNDKAALAEAVGARYVSSEETPFAELAREVGRVDLVYEAAGASEVAFEVLRELGTNGVFVFTGVPGRKQKFELDGAAIMKNVVLKNQAVIGTVNASREDFVAAVRDLGRFDAAWPAALRQIITARHPLEAFCARAKDKEGIKHVIAVGE